MADEFQVVNHPKHGKLKFPASMSDDDIHKAIDDLDRGEEVSTFAKDAKSSFTSELGDTAGAVVGAAKAIPDVVRGLFSSDPEVSKATRQGFAQGGKEGVEGVLNQDALTAATGIRKPREGANLGSRAGSLLFDLSLGAAMTAAGGAHVKGKLGGVAKAAETGAESSILKDAESAIKPKVTGTKFELPHGFDPGLDKGLPSWAHIKPEDVGGGSTHTASPTPHKPSATSPAVPHEPAPAVGSSEPAAPVPPVERNALDDAFDKITERRARHSAADSIGPMTTDDAIRSGGDSALGDRLTELVGQWQDQGVDPDSFLTPAKPEDIERIATDKRMPYSQVRKLGEAQRGDEPMTLAESRRYSGSAKAAQDPRLRQVEQEVGIPLGKSAVTDITGEPSRVPFEASNRFLDDAFARLIADERGAVGPDIRASLSGKKNWSEDLDPARYRYRNHPDSHFNWMEDRGKSNVPDAPDTQAQLKSAFDEYLTRIAAKLKNESGAVPVDVFKDIAKGLNQVRVAGMLSGYALPKSILGNVGAIASASAENHSLNPIKEAFRVPTNLKSMKQAWSSTSNPAAISGAGRINIPGRIMGMFDSTTQELLQRAGLSEDQAQRLLLTRPHPMGKGSRAEKVLNSPAGRAIMPFQRTPWNQFIEGMSGENWNTPTRAALTAGSGLVGEQVGENTKDPRILALTAAIMGPRSVPFLLGAAMGGAGTNATAGVSPVPEWTIPHNSEGWYRLLGLDPAFTRVWDDTTKGRRGRSDHERSGNRRSR